MTFYSSLLLQPLNFIIMFNTKNAIFYSTSPNVCDYVFNKYLNNIDYRQLNREENRVFDHLGMIDTLGHNQETTANSYHYSCEGGCIFCIQLLGLYFVYADFDKKESYVFKHNPFKCEL